MLYLRLILDFEPIKGKVDEIELKEAKNWFSLFSMIEIWFE